MDFQSDNHSADMIGMNQCIDDLNTMILTNVSSVIRNTSDVEAAVRSGWCGNASEKFITNINKAKEMLIGTLNELQIAFELELNDIKSTVLNIDDNIVVED